MSIHLDSVADHCTNVGKPLFDKVPPEKAHVTGIFPGLANSYHTDEVRQTHTQTNTDKQTNMLCKEKLGAART